MTDQQTAPPARRLGRCLLIGDTTTTVPAPPGWLAMVVSPSLPPGTDLAGPVLADPPPEGLLLLGAADEVAAELAGTAARPVLRPGGPVVATPEGMLFTPGGTWWRHTPGGRRVAAGPRWPAPAWQPLIPEQTPWPVAARPVPCGWLLPAGDSPEVPSADPGRPPLPGIEPTAANPATATTADPGHPRPPAGHAPITADLASAVAVDPDRPRLLIGPSLTGDELAAALRALPPAVRPTVDVVPLAPGQGAGRAVTAAAAQALGEPIRLVNGVPLHTPSGEIAVYALDAAGRPAWAEPAWLLRLLPGGQEEVLASSPPQPSLRAVDAATYAMDLGWLVHLSGRGIHAEPSGPPRPARGRAEVPAQRPPVVVELSLDLSTTRRPHTTPEPAAGTSTPSPTTTEPAAHHTTATTDPAAPVPADASDTPATTTQPAAHHTTATTDPAAPAAANANDTLAANTGLRGLVGADATGRHGCYSVVVGTPGLDINDLLWPVLSALFTALLPDIPAAVEISVAGNATPWGLAAAKELAERHPGVPIDAPVDTSAGSTVATVDVDAVTGAEPAAGIPAAASAMTASAMTASATAASATAGAATAGGAMASAAIGGAAIASTAIAGRAIGGTAIGARPSAAGTVGGGAAKPFLPAELLPLAGTPAATESAGRTAARRRPLLIAAAVLVLLLIGVGVAAAWPGRGGGLSSSTSEQPRYEPGVAPAAPGASGDASAPRRSSSPARARSSASGAQSASRSGGGSASAPAGPPIGPAATSATPSQTQLSLGDGVNLAAGRSTSESSHNDVYGSANITDGDPTTYWESRNKAFPQWVQVDLGTAADLRRAVLRLPPSSAWPTRTQTIEFQASGDNRTYTSLAGPASYTFAQSSGQRVTVPLPGGQWRYVRLVFSSNTVWPAGQLSSLELYRT
ncbi:discoidin domain-containing protein [Dactylosporangium sp. CA-092794]|uniref:discoidin domain-containing protein n=1 Tax=Dactylosporangium sp. CA-092794 TaxID=3239929 RepID=UPI003D93DE0C